MSDLSEQVFKDEDTGDNFLFYGDEQISAENLPDEVPESAEGQPAAEKKIEEIIFAITGEDGKEQQLPFAKLTPELVKPWYEAHRNKTDWNKSNTEKAKQLADERRAHEAQKQQFDTLHQQYERWESYFRSNKPLQQLVAAFVQGRIPQQVLTQILGQQAGQQTAGGQPAQGPNPYLDQVVQRLTSLEQTLQKDREVRLQDKQLTEREQAMQSVLPHIPEEKREAFKQYIEQATSSMTDLQAMYKILADAFQWGNKDTLIQAAQQKGAADLKKKQGAGVETGEQQSAVGLPQNVDSTKDIDTMYQEFADQMG